MTDVKAIGTDRYRWDLSCFYDGPEDPRLEADIQAIELALPSFRMSYKGQLKEKLGPAIADLAAITCLTHKVFAYLASVRDLDLNDARINSKMADLEKRVDIVWGEHLSFFDIEVVALDQADIDRQAAADATVAKHRPFLEGLRLYKDHLLSEEVEAALTKRSSFGASSWSAFFDEVEADLRFEFRGAKLQLDVILDKLTEEDDPAVRAELLKIVNDGLKGPFAKYSAQTLYQVAGAKAVEDKERRYGHPMAGRNLSNGVPDATVEALHAAVRAEAPPLIKRFYRLKAALLGLPGLRWSDRNAKLPRPPSEATAAFDEALKIVVDAYTAFSPTLGGLVQGMIDKRRIDAGVRPGKASGAYNRGVVIPDHGPEAFTLLNYQGSVRDVMVVAHELGHGVHHLLAGAAQGQLMFHAPTAYAETASVFGEMLVFDHLRRQLAGDPRKLLALVMDKINDVVNTIVRQIGFSNFERRLHGAGRKLSVEELCGLWLECVRELYGPDGDVFTYEDADHLWAYISHFHRPFYVYGYAFGELLTHSLFAQRGRLGERFEPLYLDLLRAGGTKDAKELLEPFGLDPNDPKFWSEGLRLSLGELIAEAEKLSYLLGLKF